MTLVPLIYFYIDVCEHNVCAICISSVGLTHTHPYYPLRINKLKRCPGILFNLSVKPFMPYSDLLQFPVPSLHILYDLPLSKMLVKWYELLRA